ncbi:MAG TPA: hypothetical protein VFG52_08930 [Xanthomonadales bacterium]|nr:hypothetical protein [Xanthomonadales bacterium]
MTVKTAALIFALLASAYESTAMADSYPLFRDDGTLDLVIEVPMSTLHREADQNPVLPGFLRYVDADGNEITLDIELTTRGRSRLKYCQFPPLSITIVQKQPETTLFAGQGKLKIGTHCRKGAQFVDYLEQEFGIYQAYRQLTDYSFRVRKLRITYRDIENKRKDEIHPAFFIESVDEAAGRLGMEEIKSPKIRVSQLDAEQTSISGLYQYLIANTDWDITKGPGSEDCCHNGKLVGRPGTQENWVVLPYDFDQAGLINTGYAMPSPALGIRSVRTRLYRGECRYNDRLDETIALFNARRGQIESTLVPESLSPSTRKSAMKYIGEFYSTINDTEKRKKHIESACLKGG